MWCGDRQTVFRREASVHEGLEFGGFFAVPHKVSINKSASYGFQWNRIWNLSLKAWLVLMSWNFVRAVCTVIILSRLSIRKRQQPLRSCRYKWSLLVF